MAYEFTQDSFRQFSEEVISAGGDQATLTTLLSQMQDVIIDNIGKMEQLTQNNENVTKENGRLKSANMDLFLRMRPLRTRPRKPPKKSRLELTIF